MYCPNCRSEFEPHVKECGRCNIALVENLTPEEQASFQATVKVFQTGNQGELAIAESLLQSANIPYDVQNALVQDWIGAGSVGTGFNIVLGAPCIVVPIHYAEAAAEVLTPPSTPIDEAIFDVLNATKVEDEQL